MDSQKLLLQLQEEAAKWPVDMLKKQYHAEKVSEYPVGSEAYLNEKNTLYNLKTMLELKENAGSFYGENIPDPYDQHFIDSINGYMDTYAPGQKDLKDYIRILSLYKTFVAKLPLHPPEMQLPAGGKVYQKGKDYFCTAKRQYIHDKDSLCRFCTAKMCEYE
ncbi:MAG TPA: DUF2115 family protein [Clostridiales bacterium]|nr:DUF2115 family protein [Clostridiales bacterium]